MSCVLLGASEGPAPEPGAVKVAVSMTHHANYTASLTLSVDRRAVCQIKLTEQQTSGEREVCAFELPAAAREIAVSGEFTHLQSGQPPTRGSRRWRIVDLAPMVSPLREPSRPFGERTRAFLQAKERLEKTHAVLRDNVEIDTATGETEEAVKAAEARLKFPLPPDHVSFLRQIGTLTVGESSTIAAGELQRASRQLDEIWELPAAARKTLKPSTRAFLDASTMLYSSLAPDYGYGGLFYEPALPGRPSACGQQPAYHWIHADMISEPTLLKKSDGKSCKSYSDVMLSLFVSDMLKGWDEAGVELVFIDRSAPTTMPLVLTHAPHENLFPLALHPRWWLFE